MDAPLDAALVTAIMTALHTGFRHLDGAESYNNERELGAAVAAAAAEGVMREEVFVTTKVRSLAVCVGWGWGGGGAGS